MKILIADDDPIFMSLVVDILADNGDEVLPAENGRIAWELLQAEGADVAVLDVNMPEMDGSELIKLIREDDRFKRLPVLVLATGFTAEDLVQQYDPSITDFLTKPFEISELIGKVAEMQGRIT
ncbi:MAG TPA: response regulator [Elusimicrobiales bacterium]|nr:response regulator [Elusimicrobiales bacterium]